MTETPWESSPEDAAEQRVEVVPGEDRGDPRPAVPVPWDANPADAAEQGREVPLDEDDWR